MINSKILITPEFNNVPKSELADCEENIEIWINNNNKEKLSILCRYDSSRKNGYRFVNCNDFRQKIEKFINVLGVTLTVVWDREYHNPDHFCPLYFKEWRTSIKVSINHGEYFEFKSDNDLKKRIKLEKCLKEI